MREILKLNKGIMIDGKQVTELSYDVEEITDDLFMLACAKSSIAGTAMNASATIEINTALHLNLGKAAIIAANPGIDWDELTRVKGRDILTLSRVGRFFITGTSEEISEENSSESTSETTQSTTTQV